MDFGKQAKNDYKRTRAPNAMDNNNNKMYEKNASVFKAWMVMFVMTNVQLVVVNKWNGVPQFAHTFPLNISFLEAYVGWISQSF